MILSEIQRFLNQIFISLDWDIILFVALGFQILLTIFFIVKSHFAYEMRVVKKLVKLNGWLSKYQFIDSNNLLEFNDLMKKTPKLLRYYWHQYMLYREKEPSHYMSPYNCIEKPLKTSSFKSNIKNYMLTSFGFALFIFVLGVVGLGTIDVEFFYLAKAMIAPIFIIILTTIFVMILRARENRNLSALYQYFHYFNRFMDRAVTTMPPYVDFEVLFTASEIRKGIPVLNEYLEKRARQEQEELERARLYAVEHETFDFAEAGLNGSLVLDRAMKEAETYLNIRQRLISEIEQFESEIDSLKRNYENTQREYEKKMQASKENVARLRSQQEESTNRIESNYIKKQQSDEIKKQEQLEKDHDSATVRFNQEMEVLIAEINSRKKDLEERRQYVEDAMKAEYQTFSLKMFKSISAALEDKTQQEKDKIIGMKDEIVVQLEDAIMQISEKNAEINELRDVLKKHKIKYAGYGNFESRKLQAETKKIRRGKKGSDETIDEFDYDYVPNINIEQPAETIGANEKATSDPQVPAGDIVYDENGGYYDNEGNYRYKNGAYYDKQGIYHDEKGGWFEADGVTYHPPETDDAGDGKAIVPVEIKGDLTDSSQKTEEQKEEQKSSELDKKSSDSDKKSSDKKSSESNENSSDKKSLEKKTVTEKSKEKVSDKPQTNQSETEKPEEETPAPEKKKRGRPKKEKTEEEPKIKRPRGRPRKEVAEETEEKPKEKRGRGRPKKEKTEEVLPAVKRPRGRPKKEKTSAELQLLNKQIADENSKLKKQQEEFKSQLDEALSTFNEED